MKRQLLAALIGAALIFETGCGTLIPKRVEFFQDKVQKFPEESAKYREAQRRAAELAERRAQDALAGAIAEDCSTNVVGPIKDTRDLTGAVSDSLGSPLKPTDDVVGAITELRKSMARLDAKIEAFKQSNDENAGKKIEGTGLFSVPYFIWIGLVALMAFGAFIVVSLIWTALKVYSMSNPPLALGLNAVQAGGNFAKKALTQLIKGGEEFKDAVSKEVTDPELLARINRLFQVHQRMSQDLDVQAVVKELTRKG